MNVNLVYTVLRPTQTAIVHHNNDGTYTIFVNSNKSQEKQRQGILHEIQHIKGDDFYSESQANLIERILHNKRPNEDDLKDINFYTHIL